MGNVEDIKHTNTQTHKHTIQTQGKYAKGPNECGGVLYHLAERPAQYVNSLLQKGEESRVQRRTRADYSKVSKVDLLDYPKVEVAEFPNAT